MSRRHRAAPSGARDAGRFRDNQTIDGNAAIGNGKGSHIASDPPTVRKSKNESVIVERRRDVAPEQALILNTIDKISGKVDEDRLDSERTSGEYANEAVRHR